MNNARRFLDYFYLLIGMKVNFEESEIIVFGKDGPWKKKIEKKLNCKGDNFTNQIAWHSIGS